MTESQPKTERKRGTRTGAALLSLALVGGAATAGCSAVVKGAGRAFHDTVTYPADPTISTTKAIKKQYPSAEDIEMHFVADGEGTSYMTWDLPDGKQCRVDTNTPANRISTATRFSEGETPATAICLMPSPSPSPSHSAHALGAFGQPIPLQ